MNANDFLDGLEDDDLWADAPSENITPFNARVADADLTAMPAGPQFKERCDRCGGSGKFRGWSGRILGDCNACRGAGFKTFKTSGADRAKARLQATTRKANKIADWHEAHPAESAWLKRAAGGDRPFEFATKMLEALAKYGHLTDNQQATVVRLAKAQAERDAARKIERERERAAAPTLSAEPVMAAFAKAISVAKAEAIKRVGGNADRATFKAPKLRLGEFFITLAPATGRNAGALYVKRTGDREYLGKIADGKFSKSFVCTPVEQDAVVKACSDPEAAAVAYGKLHSSCAICGKGLDNYESIARGIGPKCASKWGW